MIWHDNHLHVFDAATAEEQGNLLQHLTSIEPTFDYSKHCTAAKLKKFPALSRTLQQHTVSGAYVWQYFKDTSCLDVPAMPQRDDTTTAGAPVPEDKPLLPVPAPVPTAAMTGVSSNDSPGDKKYCQFQKVHGFLPDYSHAPSVGLRFKKLKNSGVGFSAPDVRGMIQCQSCSKFRAYFCATLPGTTSAIAWSKIYMCDLADFNKETDIAKQKLMKKNSNDAAILEISRVCDDDPQFVCGAALFPPGHALYSTVVTRADLHCESHMEVQLYKMNVTTQKRVQFDTSLCGFCGIVSVDESVLEKQDGELPRCESCLENNATAVPIMSKVGRKRAGKKDVQARRKAARRTILEEDISCEEQRDEESSVEVQISSDDADDGIDDGATGSDIEWGPAH
jgi:hypothetical protein